MIMKHTLNINKIDEDKSNIFIKSYVVINPEYIKKYERKIKRQGKKYAKREVVKGIKKVIRQYKRH